MFSCHWFATALDELADIYVGVNNDERDRIGGGVAALNTRLADDPLAVGESRDYDFRIAFPSLLCVHFRVDVPHRQVRVTRVVRYGK